MILAPDTLTPQFVTIGARDQDRRNLVTNGVVSAQGGRLQKLVMKNRKFTNTAIPVFSGTEGWYQHIHIVQAIVKSNGWPEETAALQLFVHLKGEALNVALL